MTSSIHPLLSEDNPYAPPVATPLPLGSPEQIRGDNLAAESDIQSIGIAIMLLGFFLVLVPLAAASRDSSADIATCFGWIMCGLFLGSFGKAVHQLRSWVRWPIVFVSLPLMIFLPFGPIVSSLVLYRFFNRNGKTILGPEYGSIMKQTPGMRCRSSIFFKALTAFLLLLAAFYNVFLLLSR